MVPDALIARRLHATGLLRPRDGRPADVVRRLGAVQAQEQAVARWSLAQRCTGTVTAADVDAALASGEIIRTHVLRPTWHYVHAADVRTALQATRGVVQRLNAPVYRQLDLDLPTRERCVAVLVEALAGGHALTRAEVGAVLSRSGVEATGLRLGYVLMHAELEAIVGSGPPRGRQHTWSLLDERVPATAPVDDDTALAWLTRTYLSGHGPASAKDLQWWTGLPLATIARGVELAGDALVAEEVDGVLHWSSAGEPVEVAPEPSPHSHLVQGYDEVFSYHRAGSGTPAPAPGEPAPPLHAVLTDGRVAGRWRQATRRGTTTVTVERASAPTSAEQDALEAAAAAYAAFLGIPVSIETAGC